MSKATRFKKLLSCAKLEFLMEAHNGLSAKVVEEAGFKGIWASGLSISAAMCLRDNNEASWTQVLEVVEHMADATAIPILLDGDTGYGNFNNIRRLVRKLEQRDIAAVCIEDKLFPKVNSLIRGQRQSLADIEEFAGKIKAVKDAQNDPDFCVVARLEALIAGWGLGEALRRAEAYLAAGADALLVHSKKPTPDEILAFSREWYNRCPLVIVPTMYYSTPVEVFEQAGISIVIWANHNVRASIAAMQKTSRRIFRERSTCGVEDRIAPIREVFRLQNAEELLEAEDRYLPKRSDQSRAIILAASRGGELGEITLVQPKAMAPIGGVPLLHKLVSQIRCAHIKDIVVVRGYGKDAVDAPDVRFIDNDEFEETGELLSLRKAESELEGDLLISFGDILFRQYILNNLLAEDGDIVIAVDAVWEWRGDGGSYTDYVTTSRPYSLKYGEEDAFLANMASDLPRDQINGEWIGLIKATRCGTVIIRAALDTLATHSNFRRLRFDDLFRLLLSDKQPVKVLFITGHWIDVDRLTDFTKAQAF